MGVADTPAHMTPGSLTPSWAETPRADRGAAEPDVKAQETPSASKRRSRWDLTPAQTPQVAGGAGSGTPGQFTPSGTPSRGAGAGGGFTPGGMTPSLMTPSGVTPTGSAAMAMQTPHPSQLAAMTPEQIQAYRWEKEIDDRNRPLSDEELDSLFPPGYKVRSLLVVPAVSSSPFASLPVLTWFRSDPIRSDQLRSVFCACCRFCLRPPVTCRFVRPPGS